MSLKSIQKLVKFQSTGNINKQLVRGMTTWQDTQFDSKSYAQYRPTYEKPLFYAIYQYHQSNNGKFNLALDLGTGTGQVATELVHRFDQVVGVDSSEVMIGNATQHPKIKYEIGDCLNIPVADRSVDLLVVAQAIHWFPIPKFWEEVRRVVKPGGTFGFWGYSMTIAPKYPKLTREIYELSSGTYSKYWDEGRTRLDVLHQDYLVSLPFKNIQGRVFHPHPHVKYDPKLLELVSPKEEFATSSITPSGFVKKMTSLNQLTSYLKTWSGYHNFIKQNPQSKDPVDQIIENALEETGLSLDDPLELVYPQEIILSQV